MTFVLITIWFALSIMIDRIHITDKVPYITISYIARFAQTILKLLRMFITVIRLALTFLVINLFVTSCEGFREEGLNDQFDRDYIGYPNPLSSLSSGGLSRGPTRGSLGLSAWGIVTVIVSIMLAIVGMYYISICYPILCKKSRKCDMLHLTSAV